MLITAITRRDLYVTFRFKGTLEYYGLMAEYITELFPLSLILLYLKSSHFCCIFAETEYNLSVKSNQNVESK